MSQFLEARRNARRKINARFRIDRNLHLFITAILLINMVLILYALFSISLRMTLGGVGLVDTLPIALYLLPLLIFLPLMIRSYYKDRTAALNFVFLLIATVVFGLLSTLVRGFIICMLFNIFALTSLFIVGRFRPKASLRKIGKKGLAYFLLLNILGFTFPVSVVIMGQFPIAVSTPSVAPDISLTVPLSDFDYHYQNLIPTPALLSEIGNNDMNLNLQVDESNATSWNNLRSWLVAINETEIDYSITLESNRDSFAGESITTLASTDIIEKVYSNHSNSLQLLNEQTLVNISNLPYMIFFDMTLSRHEWQALMLQTRSLNLIGFGNLMRTSLDSTQLGPIQNESTTLYQQTKSLGFNAGLVVESFAIDDIQDGDTGAMRLCGITVESLSQWDQLIVSCRRSRFSFEMLGDVGEYLAYSYSSSIGILGDEWGILIGDVGNMTDIQGRQNHVYESLDVLLNDISLVLGNGVSFITLDSLPSLLSAFGNESINELGEGIALSVQGTATYTFRIYAYRAVFMAIDAFDFIML